MDEEVDAIRQQQLECIAVELIDLLQLDSMAVLGRYICVQTLIDTAEATGFDELPKPEYDYLIEALGTVATEDRNLYILDDADYQELLAAYKEFEARKGLDGPQQYPSSDQELPPE